MPSQPARKIAVLAALWAGGVACDGADSAPAVSIVNPAADTTVDAGATIAFRSIASDPGAVAAHEWRFGPDRESTDSVPPAVTYDSTGWFLAQYRATGPGGGMSTPAWRFIAVGAPADSQPNYALRFHGTGRSDIDRVKIPVHDPMYPDSSPSADIGATDFTIEFWIRADRAANTQQMVTCGDNVAWINGNVLLDRDRYSQPSKYGASIAGSSIVFGVTDRRDRSVTVCGERDVTDGNWHHVAVTRSVSTGAIRIFVDGQLDAEVSGGPAGDISYPDGGEPGNYCGGPCTWSDPYLVIGAEKHDAGPDYPSFSGDIDELRLSTTIRYTETFTPPTGPFVPDEATAALYHFDEGRGEVIVDSARHPRGPSHGVRRVGGNPEGPEWIESSAPTGGTPE